MNNIKSVDKDIINETDSDLVNILLFERSKYQYHSNSKTLSFSINFIHATGTFFGQLFGRLDNVNNKFINSFLIISLLSFDLVICNYFGYYFYLALL